MQCLQIVPKDMTENLNMIPPVTVGHLQAVSQFKILLTSNKMNLLSV